MDLKKIDNLFLNYCFKKEKLYIDEEELSFDNVYVNENNTEVYVVEKINLDDLNKNKIEEYQEEILWFENFTENYFLKYNVNLVIVYDGSQDIDEVRKYIEKYERDSNICKKIFLDINSDDSLCILPFSDIEILTFQENRNLDTRNKLKEIIKSDELIRNLSKYDINDEYIENNIISILECEG